VFYPRASAEIKIAVLKAHPLSLSNNLVAQWKPQLPDYHPSILWPMAKCKAKTSLIILVRNNKLGISNNWMAEGSLQVTISNYWKKIKINHSLLMSPVIKAAFKSKRIWTCVEAPLRPELIAKIIRVHIMRARINQLVKRKFQVQPIHTLRIVDLGQLQSNNSKVIVTLGPSTLEWWEVTKCQILQSIHQELEADHTFKLIKIRDQAPAK